MTQSFDKEVTMLPAIKPELHLREIPRKMLCADLVPRANESARVAATVIRHDNFDVARDVLLDVLRQRPTLNVLGVDASRNPLDGFAKCMDVFFNGRKA